MGFKAKFSSSDSAFATNFNNEAQKHSPNFGTYNTIYDGQNGATFYPDVSEDGILSWTNDRELPNPTPRKVRGEDGKDGFSPIVSVTDIEGGHKVTIADKEGEKTFDVMDGKDGQGGGGVTSWNDLQDKPFGSEFEYVELASATGVVDYYNADNLVASFQATLDFVPISQKLYKLVATDGVQTIEAVHPCSIMNMPAVGLYSENIGIAVHANAPIRMFRGSKDGAWTVQFLATIEVGAEWTITVYEHSEIITPLDGKYLPDGIPFVASASVGQGIAVKAVDGNKPIEFEAVNLVKSYNDLTDVPVKEVITTLISERTVAYSKLMPQSIGEYDLNGCNLVSFDGEKYKVQEVYDGQFYYYGNRYLYGTWNPDNGLPFLLRHPAIGQVSLYVKDIGTHTISAYKQELTFLSEKYLPDSVVLESELEAKGYQTEEQVTALINDAIANLPRYNGEVEEI